MVLEEKILSMLLKRELDLLYTSYSTQESRSCTPPRQHLVVDIVVGSQGGTGEPALRV